MHDTSLPNSSLSAAGGHRGGHGRRTCRRRTTMYRRVWRPHRAGRVKGINVRVGCGLIGILVVVVILGIAAALTVSSLGGNPAGTIIGSAGRGASGTANGGTRATAAGIPAQAAITACEADAATVKTAVADYSAANGVSPSVVTVASLTSGPSPYFRSYPSSPDFTISIVSGVVMIAAPSKASPVPFGTAGACAKAGP